MKLKLLFLTGVYILITACQDQKKKSSTNNEPVKQSKHSQLPDSLSARRISFVLDLKESVARKSWPGFGDKRNEGTLIYFDDNNSEFFFADPSFIRTINNYSKFSEDYGSSARVDSIPWHMEVMISFDDADSSRFYYKNPVEQYSSVEEIGKYIPSVESTEMWATMVLHEMFHHYQYNNENFKEYARSEIGALPFNINHIISLGQEDKNYLKMIQQENDYLVQALSSKGNRIRDSIIISYLTLRKDRIQKYSPKYPHLEKVENYYVIQEGSARYIEYQSMQVLSILAAEKNSPRVSNDSMFKSYSEFEAVDLKKPSFNYLTYAAPTDYHYTIGFNIMRLLDKLQIEYKTNLLNNPEKALHQYLEDYIDTLPYKIFKQ